MISRRNAAKRVSPDAEPDFPGREADTLALLKAVPSMPDRFRTGQVQDIEGN
jgi:hypothetical protein